MKRLILLFAVLTASGCANSVAAVHLGNLLVEQQLAGRLLPVDTPLGKRVYTEGRTFSSSIKEYVASHGTPDYVVAEQPRPGALLLFTLLYAKTDTAVYFRNPNPVSLTAHYAEVIEENPMPRALWGRMSNAQQASSPPIERSLYGRWRKAYERSPTAPGPMHGR